MPAGPLCEPFPSDILNEFVWELPNDESIAVQIVERGHFVFQEDNTSEFVRPLSPQVLLSLLGSSTYLVVMSQPSEERYPTVEFAIFYRFMDRNFKTRYVMACEEVGTFHMIRRRAIWNARVRHPELSPLTWQKDGF